MGGKKDEALRPHQIKQGYHIASISYPFGQRSALATCMLESALVAVQFIRFKAGNGKSMPVESSRPGGSAMDARVVNRIA